MRSGRAIFHAMLQLQLPGDFTWRIRIDRKARAHSGPRGVVHFVDQAGSQFSELALFFAGMVRGLDIEIRQHTEQRRADVDALAPG